MYVSQPYWPIAINIALLWLIWFDKKDTKIGVQIPSVISHTFLVSEISGTHGGTHIMKTKVAAQNQSSPYLEDLVEFYSKMT